MILFGLRRTGCGTCAGTAWSGSSSLRGGGHRLDAGCGRFNRLPLGKDRFGDPEELIGPIMMLLSDAAGFIHGVTLCVDGGFNVYSGVGPLDEKRG